MNDLLMEVVIHAPIFLQNDRKKNAENLLVMMRRGKAGSSLAMGCFCISRKNQVDPNIIAIKFTNNEARQFAYSMRLLAASSLQAAPALRSGGMPVEKCIGIVSDAVCVATG
ncbi:hypothetical protein [Undibacterium sp.]|uniref:hypothetical protein n=1 Tax=Undibacterium sp. TaxID=1914977 RepID=UPI0025F71E81|nr:hypothetical protein [Undibacterium sp.]